MNDFAPQRRALPWTRLIVLGICAAGAVACRPTGTNTATVPEAMPGTAEGDLRDQLNPVHQPPPPRATAFVAPPPWNPSVIFPVPIRSWLPPAEAPESPRILHGEQRIATSPPHSIREVSLLAPIASGREPLILPAPPLPRATSPDPARITVWIATRTAPEARGRPPAWDRPQLSTDPTAGVSRDSALTSPTGLRETPPPFLRLTIPDPFEQLAIAELRNPPPENEPSVTPFTRPATPLPEIPGAPVGK